MQMRRNANAAEYKCSEHKRYGTTMQQIEKECKDTACLGCDCLQVLLVQPSSATSEHVFSLTTNSFGERQQNSFQDYMEASLMLQYKEH